MCRVVTKCAYVSSARLPFLCDDCYAEMLSLLVLYQALPLPAAITALSVLPRESKEAVSAIATALGTAAADLALKALHAHTSMLKHNHSAKGDKAATTGHATVTPAQHAAAVTEAGVNHIPYSLMIHLLIRRIR